ncbi:hypothetical protein SISSUDRAFT_1046229 [Sistotremastrum suecicum HHB10207 ss-3]|uniref:Zn(2)-C6 fungal-type domain-containing protein n=1 Tax=Sistotremastrum suecicum HHB10207 ss-3 TaxID=1314776 RepID=A0A166DYI6_9AGAM|nr:hypothetical protein SISSUDRAFT_1046229 [Sistotremastrum suecicum HHB10207 ss-3]
MPSTDELLPTMSGTSTPNAGGSGGGGSASHGPGAGGGTGQGSGRAPRRRADRTEGHLAGGPDAGRTLSCSECRRLKLKCDRKWPCQSCIKRGCASICPNGSLTPGQSNRFILHGSEQLHRKIHEMSQRISALEDALTILQTEKDPTSQHPLLGEELLRIKLPPDTQSAVDDYGAKDKNIPSLNSTSTTTSTGGAGGNGGGGEPKDSGTSDASDVEGTLAGELGTLTLGSDGRMNYLGKTAKIEFILHQPGDDEEAEAEAERSPTRQGSRHQSPETPFAAPSPPSSKPPDLPDDIIKVSESFIFSVPKDSELKITDLYAYLPPISRAWNLCELYFNHASWFYSPITKDEFIEETFSPVYRLTGSLSTTPTLANSSEEGRPGPHELALLFQVFAIGALTDLALPPLNGESDKYQTLSRAALCIEPPWDGCTIPLVQTIHLMLYANIMWEQTLIPEVAWVLMGSLAKFAHSLGLHRDPAKWNLGPKETQRRRLVFWELYAMDSWQSLGFGRPPSFSASHVDVQIPEDDVTDAKGNHIHARTFIYYRNCFVRDCIRAVIDHTYQIKPFRYASVLELDKKVREYDFGTLFKESDNALPTIGIFMQKHLMSCTREFALLYVHRSFFTRSLTQHPNDPLQSTYAPSVLATFRCAVALLQVVKMLFTKNPTFIGRFSLPWTYVVTTAVVTGSIVARGPRSSLAPVAYQQLNMALELFQAASVYSRRSLHALPILHRLKQRADQAINALGPGPSSNPFSPPNLKAASSSSAASPGGSANSEATDGDELDAYGGKARVVRLDTQHPQSPTSSLRGSQTPTSTPSPRSHGHVLPTNPNITHMRGHSATRSQSQPQPFGHGHSGGSANNSSHTTPLHSALSTPQPQLRENLNNNYQLYTHQLFNPGGAPTTQSISPSNPMHELELPSTSAVSEGIMGVGGGTGSMALGAGGVGDHDEHDFSWMDGFGVGAPMDQFPLVPPEVGGNILRAHDAHHLNQNNLNFDLSSIQNLRSHDPSEEIVLPSLPLLGGNTITPSGMLRGGGSPGRSGLGSPLGFGSAYLSSGTTGGAGGGSPGSPDVIMGGVGIGDDVSSWLSGPGGGGVGGEYAGVGGGAGVVDNDQWQLWLQELQRNNNGMSPGYQ